MSLMTFITMQTFYIKREGGHGESKERVGILLEEKESKTRE